jgi:GntR family transcriptional regulator/MocR family aminotransferase
MKVELTILRIARAFHRLVPRIRSDPVLLERTNSSPAGDVLVQVTRDSRVALHRQIEASIRDAIRAGRLARGASVPPTRVLAADLGVSRGVVVEAYQQLVAEGYLTSRSGSFTRVAIGPEPAARPAPPTPRRAPVVDFCPCRADVSHFPRTAWLRSVRRVLREAPDEQFGSVGGRGAPPLHHALAAYLNRVRGTSVHPDHVLVCTGYAQGIALVIDVLVRSGARRLAVEDPCADDDAVPVARAAGLEVVGVPVGDDGIRVDALDRIEADALVLTPSHQWPTGAVLSAGARSAVLRWAQRRGALIVEDDYDAEYRYDRAPIGAMQGLAPDRVIYAGTASKTLAPGLRLGWLVAPPDLVGALAEAKTLADRGSPVLDQLAFADFLARGEFDRHLRRMRPVYRRRRDALLAALRGRLPEVEPAGIAAGLHLVAYLPEDLDEAAVVEAAAAHGVAVDGLAPYRISCDGRPGLIFGYAALDERAITEGVRLLAEGIGDVRGGGPSHRTLRTRSPRASRPRRRAGRTGRSPTSAGGSRARGRSRA